MAAVIKLLALILFGIITTTLGQKSTINQADKFQRSFFNPYPRFEYYNDGDDPGEPLFLTPLINNVSIAKSKVRDMARVVGSQFLNVESYAGYLTVDNVHKSNMFFWYFPAERGPTYAPVILWLQGGPGASSLFGLFRENGPFELDDKGKVQKRNYTWSRTHNLIYIDNPVGTGFSFTEDDAGYANNERDVARNLYEGIQQLFALFNLNETSGFWVMGESYAGKYVPAIAYHIYNEQKKLNDRIHIPLKGLAIGNGFTDPQHQLDYGDYLYQLGFIDDNGLDAFHKMENTVVGFIKANHMTDAFLAFQDLIFNDSKNTTFFKLTNLTAYFNYLQTKVNSNRDDKILGDFLQSSETRRAIHVGNSTFHDGDAENKVQHYLQSDIMVSVAHWMVELLDGFTVCIYNGQLDIIVGYPLTRNYLKKLKYKDAAFYKIAKRQIWRIDDEVAGYIKQGGNLIEVLIRNAGHMVPMDQPKWTYNLIDQVTHQSGLFKSV